MIIDDQFKNAHMGLPVGHDAIIYALSFADDQVVVVQDIDHQE